MTRSSSAMQTEPDQGSGEPGRKSSDLATLDPLDLEADLPQVVEAHDGNGHPLDVLGAQHALGLGLQQRVGREPGEHIGFERADRLPGEREPGKQPGQEADQQQQQDRQHMGHRNPADHAHRQDGRDRLGDRAGDLQTLADHGDEDRDGYQEDDPPDKRGPDELQRKLSGSLVHAAILASIRRDIRQHILLVLAP